MNCKLISFQDRLDWLLNISKAILSFDDAARLGSALSELLRAVLDFEHISLQLYDQETHQIEVFPCPDSFSVTKTSNSLEKWPLALILDQKKTFVADLAECRGRFSALDEFFRLPQSGTYCMVPVVHAQRCLGGIALASSQLNAYGDDDLHILNSLALAVAEVLGRIQNHAQTSAAEAALRHESDHYRILVDVTNAVISNLDMRKLLDEVSSSLQSYFGVELVGLRLKVPNSSSEIMQLVYCSGEGTNQDLQETNSEEEPLLRSVMTSRKAFLARDESLGKMARESRLAAFLLSRGAQTICALPMVSGEKSLGVLILARISKEGFSADEVRLLQAVADRVAIAVHNAMAYSEISRLKDLLANESLYLKNEIKAAGNFGSLVGESAALAEVMDRVRMVADSDCTVLIMGETGTGKEMVARAIHMMSSRKDRTMVKVNCAAIPAGLFESDLFGHEKGSFTGAVSQEMGRFEFANHSSIFLDEVGEIPWELQPKLLRVLQEHEVDRVGGKRVIPIDVRVIAATNCDLMQLVHKHQYRSDLYYRLSTFPIVIPPLRERREDIPALVRHFTKKFAARMNRTIEYIPENTMEQLSQLPWPGNVRELENVIERAVILTKGSVLHVPIAEVKQAHYGLSSYPTAQIPSPDVSIKEKALTREHVLQMLVQANGVVGGARGAAARLGLKRTTLISRMKRLGISTEDVQEALAAPLQNSFE